jgi:hypothetical protein
MSDRIDGAEAGPADGPGAVEEVRRAWLRLLGLLADEVVRQLELAGSRQEGQPTTGGPETAARQAREKDRPSG